MGALTEAELVILEALDQYVENTGEAVELDPDPLVERRLEIARELLDALNSRRAEPAHSRDLHSF
jgi:hypothetical protein